MKSKTKISKQLRNKHNPELVETIVSAKKNIKWLKIAGILSGSRKRRTNINLEQINEIAQDKDIIAVPGKILSQGEIDKKIKIVALNFSDSAIEKLKKAGIKYSSLKEEIKQNPEAQGVRIIEK